MMNCKQSQREIALFVGQDLDDPRERDDVKRHVATCPECREHYRRMKGTLKTLAQSDAPETYTTTGSLWPELASRINDRQSRGPRGRFNGWAPFVAMTAACFILMLVVNEPQSPTGNGAIGSPTAKGPVFTNPVLHMDGPLFDNGSDRPAVSFELRNAAADRAELDRRQHDRNATDERF